MENQVHLFSEGQSATPIMQIFEDYYDFLPIQKTNIPQILQKFTSFWYNHRILCVSLHRINNANISTFQGRTKCITILKEIESIVMAKKYDNTTGSSSQKGGAKSAISARDNSNAGIAELFCGFLTRTVYIYAVRMRLLLNNSENSALIGLKICLQRPDDMLSTVHTWSLEQTIQGQWTVVDSTFRRFFMRTCAYMYAGNFSIILLSSTVHCPVKGMPSMT